MVTSENGVITRQAYLHYGASDHQAYYGQFVNPFVLRMVDRVITTERLVRSSDQRCFNDIPLNRWDMMVPTLWSMVDRDILNRAGENRSMATGVCILKAAARQLVDGYCALENT